MELLSAYVEAHSQTHRVTEIINYPRHPQRSESSTFIKNRKILLEQEKHSCFMCTMMGVHPTSELEVHHLCEWALWNSIDPIKLQRLFDTGVFDIYGYSKKLLGQPVKTPDDLRNLMVLCEQHHVREGSGIHETSMPGFLSQLVARTGVEILQGSRPKP